MTEPKIVSDEEMLSNLYWRFHSAENDEQAEAIYATAQVFCDRLGFTNLEDYEDHLASKACHVAMMFQEELELG